MTGAHHSVLTLMACFGLLASLSACGGVHAMGVSQNCATAPYLSGASGVAVRCNPQTQSPSGLTQ